MTIEECIKAAHRQCPVMSDGIVYRRIERIARVYRPPERVIMGREKSYYVVVLEDKNGRSYTETDPARVIYPEDAIEV